MDGGEQGYAGDEMSIRLLLGLRDAARKNPEAVETRIALGVVESRGRVCAEAVGFRRAVSMGPRRASVEQALGDRGERRGIVQGEGRVPARRGLWPRYTRGWVNFGTAVAPRTRPRSATDRGPSMCPETPVCPILTSARPRRRTAPRRSQYSFLPDQESPLGSHALRVQLRTCGVGMQRGDQHAPGDSPLAAAACRASGLPEEKARQACQQCVRPRPHHHLPHRQSSSARAVAAPGERLVCVEFAPRSSDLPRGQGMQRFSLLQ